MEPAQAMFNEANITRTLAVDALANRCEQLAGEKASLEQANAALREQNEKQAEELQALKEKSAVKKK